jgi:hypothetical protein
VNGEEMSWKEDKNPGHSDISVLITRRFLDILQRSSYKGECKNFVAEV